jgi:hypothetical protein
MSALDTHWFKRKGNKTALFYHISYGEANDEKETYTCTTILNSISSETSFIFIYFFLLYFKEEGNRIVEEEEEEKHKILYAPHRGSTCN